MEAANGTDSRLRGLEDALGRIQGVMTARVVVDQGDRVSEVHILASRARSPKQIVRDVQSVAIARFGFDLDYRTVSIVQLEEDGTPERSVRSERIALERVRLDTKGTSSTAEVVLRLQGQERVGLARGPGSSGLRLIARAFADAFHELLPDKAIDIDFAEIVAAGSRQVALALVRVAAGADDQVVSGSAVVRRDPADALARACLSAVNRILASDRQSHAAMLT